MKKILSILKKSTFPILFVIVLLVLQANFELALPDYTANIINIGIQQNGIEDNVIEVIRKSEMDKVLIFTESDEKILDNYSLINKDNLSDSDYKEYLKKYPLIETEDLYVLNKISDTKRDELSSLLKTPLLLVMSFEDPKNEYLKQMPEGVDVFVVFANMPKAELDSIIDKANTKFEELTSSITNQMAITGIKKEYKEIKYDIKNLQTMYIVSAGAQMLLIALFIMVFAILVAYLSSKIAAVFSCNLRSSVVSKIMGYSNREFEEISTSSLITRSTNDINQIQTLVIMVLRIVIYAPVLGFGALNKVSGSSISWVIGLAVSLIFGLVVVLFTLGLPKFKKVQTLVDRVNLVSREILTGLPVIRAFANESFEEKRFDKANIDLTKTNLFVNRLMTIMMPTMFFIMNGISVLIIWVGADKINLGQMQVGDLMAFITYTMQILIAFLMISMVSIMLPRSIVSVKRIAEVFNKKTSIEDTKNPKQFDKNKTGIVEFKDVYFRYPDAEEDVLENISFSASPGTTTAFIGSTGSGKSTLINLIPRFFDVTGGKVLIDGVNIKDVKLHDLRSKIGFVPQKGMLFSGTIESNIKFGNNKMSKEEINKAALIAQATEFIESKEEGYDSFISEGGTNVSGGQKQRLAIARAVAINPEIYIFDDSFSALDYRTDKNLRNMLKKETKNSTIFIVAQRISTVLNAEQIIVLDEGKIVGTGTHKELMNNCEIYKEIALSQLSQEELDNE